MRLMTQKPSPHYPYPRSQLGITLIELMIALVIGLLATGAMLKVYVDSSQLYRFNEGLARIQENGRFGLEFMRRDARMAGFWGCNHEVSLTNGIKTGAVVDHPRYELSDITGTNGPESIEPDEPDEPDSITFSGAGGSVATVSSDMTSPSSGIPISTTRNFKVGEALLISDCEMADIFQVTEPAGSDSSLTLIHSTTGNNSDELSKAYAAGSRLYRVQQTTFCIAEGDDPAQPSLRQLVNPTSGQTCGEEHGDDLVEGIENMQILMGEDTDADSEGVGGDGTANRYVHPETIDLEVDRIVSIRISLLAVSPNNNVTRKPAPYFFNGATVSPDSNEDRHLRKVFTTTITLRNWFRPREFYVGLPVGTRWDSLTDEKYIKCGRPDPDPENSDNTLYNGAPECRIPLCWLGRADNGAWVVGPPEGFRMDRMHELRIRAYNFAQEVPPQTTRGCLGGPGADLNGDGTVDDSCQNQKCSDQLARRDNDGLPYF